MSKEQWFRHFERLEAGYLASGVSPRTAYAMASERAQSALVDSMADAADRAKDEAKEAGKWPPKETK